MMRKADRQQLIVRLIRASRIGTQSDLRDALRAHGIECDQATVSRDIKELGLVKVVDASGGYHYALRDDVSPTVHASRLADLRRLIRTVEWSGNLLVIQTGPGNAPAAGEVFDHLGLAEILGTIAGDNTLLAVVREGVPPSKVAEKILKEVGQ